jgi:hypothetical protein
MIEDRGGPAVLASESTEASDGGKLTRHERSCTSVTSAGVAVLLGGILKQNQQYFPSQALL